MVVGCLHQGLVVRFSGSLRRIQNCINCWLAQDRTSRVAALVRIGASLASAVLVEGRGCTADKAQAREHLIRPGDFVPIPFFSQAWNLLAVT